MTSIPHVENGDDDDGTRLKNLSKTNRHFKGNPNYVRLYNREVETFFDHGSSYHGSQTKFRTSKTNHKGEFSYRGDSGYENFHGLTWSGLEKEIFFNCLCRYSIHRIDAIQEHLPGKSYLEIVAYYDALRLHVRRIKKRRELRKKAVKVKIVDQSGEKTIVVKNSAPSNRIVRYDELPIAYEVSEDLIKVEETQAELISQRERSKTNDENRRFKDIFDSYVQRLDASGGGNEGEDSSEALIDYGIASDLSKTLYLENTVVPLSSPKLVPKLHFKSLVLLEELVKLVLRKLLFCIAQDRVNRMWINDRQIDVSDSLLPLNITRGDVIRAVSGSDGRKNSHLSRENHVELHQRQFSLANYFACLPERLGITVHDGGVIVDEAECHKSFSAVNEENVGGSFFQNDTSVHDFLVCPKDLTKPSAQEKSGPYNTRVPHISSFASTPTPPNDSKQTKDEIEITDSTAELVDEELFALETNLLEEQDMMYSRMHETGILTYLTTFQQNTPAVADSMYSVEEAKELMASCDLVSDNPPAGDYEVEDVDEADDETSGNENQASTPQIVLTPSLISNFNSEFAQY